MNAYVGVSGFMTQGEVRAALASFPDCGRQLMVGVLASQKTLNDEPVRLRRRYPPHGEIRGIFMDDPRCLNLVHYASDAPPEPFYLGCLLGVSGPHCHGVQFNVTWPTPKHVAVLLEYVPKWRVVLQVRGFLSADAIVAALRPYRGLATDVLLDSSGGRGEPLDVDLVRRWVDGIRGAALGFTIGIAGGLCAENLSSVAALMREGVSIDAEGRLRDDADRGGNLDIDKVRAYLGAAGKALS